MTEKNMNPKVRFKGFTEPWEHNELGVVADLLTGFPFESKKFVNEGFFLARGINVKRGYLDTSEHISAYWHSSNGLESYLLHENDILIQMDGALIGRSYAKIERKNLPALLVQRVTRVRGIKTSNEFIYQYINRDFLTHIHSIKTETAVPHLSLNDVKSFRITSPETKEQSQIGTFFQNIDSLITLHQQQHTKLTTLKKAMLKKMFPQEGSDVPEIRFKGFSKAWEEEQLGSIADRFDNLRIPITANQRVPGNTPYYGANGIQDYVEGHTHEGEFVLIAEDGANDLKNYPVQYVNGKIWVNNHAHVLQGKKNVLNNVFLKYAVSETNIEPFLVGGGRAKLNAETMMGICIYIPSDIAEQELIGIYFNTIDNLINQHSQLLDKLKNIKKACLEKMFV